MGTAVGTGIGETEASDEDSRVRQVAEAVEVSYREDTPTRTRR